MNGSTNATQRALERAMNDLPALPSVVCRIMQIAGDEYGSAAAIESLVKSDQAVAAKLLRVVNSPYYGLSGRVGNLSQAIVVLGFHQVKNIVATLSALGLFESKNPDTQRALKRFWLHAFGAAAGAQSIAKLKRMSLHDQDLAFVLGLLMNVGQLFLVSEFGNQYMSLLSRTISSGGTLVEAEQRVFGITHAGLSRMLIERWNLPTELSTLAAEHEGPFDSGSTGLLYGVHVADRIAWEQSSATAEEATFQTIAPEADAWLAFTDEEYDWYRREVATRIQAATEFVGGRAIAA